MDSPIRKGEWVALEVIAAKNYITIKVNGATVVDFRDDHRRYSKGHIALQCFGRQTQVGFHKIEIKELVGEDLLAITAPEINALQKKPTSTSSSKFRTSNQVEGWSTCRRKTSRDGNEPLTI